MQQQFTINELDMIRSREAVYGMGSLDAKRPDAWRVYGYPDEITFERMLAAYSRGGPGHGAVHRILDKCWQSKPRIKRPESDDVTPWETKINQLLASINAWAKLRDLDRRNMVGRYAALIYRVGDGLRLDQPLVRASRLVDLIPVYESQIRVTAWNSDTASEDYGKPSMFQYRRRNPSVQDTQGQPDEWADVHPSRVQILAEGSVGDMFDGVPLLKAGFNHLIDLEKISGGSAESYLKNSARTLVFQYDPAANVQAIGSDGKSVRQVHEEQTQALNRNTDSSIVLQGGQASTLQTATHDPEPSFLVAANLFSASVRLPFTVLFGQQTGRLASDEDKEDFSNRARSRQETELTPMLAEFVSRMQAAGIIEAGEFEIEWPPLDAPGDKDKLEILKAMTAAMREAFGSGVQGLFDVDELRAAAGYEPVQGENIAGDGTNAAP